MKKITYKDIRSVMQNAINDDIESESIFNQLLPIIEKHNGKPIGKKLLEDIQKVFPNAKYDRFIGQTNIEVVDTKGYSKYLISYSGVVEAETLKKQTWCQNIHHKRIDKNTEQSDERLKAIAKALNQFNESAEILNSINSYDLPAIYDIMRLSKYEIKERR